MATEVETAALGSGVTSEFQMSSFVGLMVKSPGCCLWCSLANSVLAVWVAHGD